MRSLLSLFVFFLCYSTLSLDPARAASLSLPFEGTDLLTQKKLSIAAKDKSGVVAVFLSAKCPCSNSHTPVLKELAKDFPQYQFVAIHSNTNEDLEQSKNYFKNLSLPFPVIQDDHAKIADQFKALKTPHAYVLSPKGDILYQGGVTNSADASESDKNFLRSALEDLKNNKPVQNPNARTLGCAIKRG